MSIRAYKIVKIETEEDFTFNLSRDGFILEIPSREWYADEGDIYHIEYSRESVQEFSDNFEQNWRDWHPVSDKDKTEEKKEEYKEILKKILEDFGTEDYVLYECY